MNKQPASSRSSETRPPILSKAFQLVLAGILIAANLFLFRSVHGKKKDLNLLMNQNASAQVALEEAEKDQRTGMLAASILNEQEGWENAVPVAASLLDYFASAPKELRVSTIFLDRPLLLRSLPEEKQNAFFHYTLAAAGVTSIGLEEVETGQAKYVVPRFLEDTRSNFDTDFALNNSETETGETAGRWRLSTEWPLQLLWEDTPLVTDFSEKQEDGFDG